MKKIIIYILVIIVVTLIVTPNCVYAQDEATNLEKYWRYRQRFRDHFIYPSEFVEEPGVNWPAFEYKIDEDDGWSKILDFSDGNPNIFAYATVLSTELWLLKNNGQDYSSTLQDLYYFMLAIERLDCYSEYHWRIALNKPLPQQTIDYPDEINGYHSRDDVSEPFWQLHQYYFIGDNAISEYYEWLQGFGSIYSSDGIAYMEGSSHDNLARNFAGLAILHALVGEEDVTSIPVIWNPQLGGYPDGYIKDYLENKDILTEDGGVTTIDFGKWAEDIIIRYIDQLQAPWPRIIPPVDLIGTVLNLPGFYTGGDLFTHWVLRNPVSGDLVPEGNGADGGIFYTTGWGFLCAASHITGEPINDLLEYPLDKPDELIYKALLAPPNLEAEKLTWYIESVAATLDDALIGDTYNRLINIRNDKEMYEILPLVYLVVHDADKYNTGVLPSDYNDEYNYYLDLLNIAPTCFSGSDFVPEYSGTCRLVWRPDEVPEEGRLNNGLDYMALHNLFYVVFRPNDFRYINVVQDILYGPKIKSGAGIYAYNSIYDGDVVYEATNPNYHISLKPGFHAYSGCDFTATISSTGNYGSEYTVMYPDECDQYVLTPPSSKGLVNNDSIFFEDDIVELNDTLTIGTKILSFGEATCNIFPNPVNDYAKLVIENVLAEEVGVDGITIDVFDVTGKNVIHLQTIDTQVDLDMSGFNPGMYSVRVYSDAFQFNKQIVKK